MYIKKCSEQDRKEILDFVGDEPSFNLFIIGDIEAFGFEEDFQEVWGAYTDEHQLEGVLLRFNESFIPYWKKEDFDVTGFVETIHLHQKSASHDKSGLIISGKDTIIGSISGFFPELVSKPTFFCELNDRNSLQSVDNTVKIATEEDAERIFELMETIEEFSVSVPPERIAHKIKTRTGRIYYMEDENSQIIAVTQTSAENSKSAMIVGVATRKGYRGHGYMSRCLTKLCSDLIEEGKSLCLFYDNPEAGKVYHRVGFKTIGQWVMLK